MDKKTFSTLLRDRILILDGATGTMIQSYGLTESDFRGERFADWPCDLRGNNDILVLTRPEIITEIAGSYIDAGADIISTDTFNANAISMADYGMESLVGEINREAAKLLRHLADERSVATGRQILVAGSVGPTNKTASMSPDVNDPALRNITYDDLYAAYLEQITALIEGGVDLILFETVFDTLNLKAGLDAARKAMEVTGRDCGIMVSATISGPDGRTFSGQTLPAFIASISHADIASVGLNCSFGAAEMLPHVAELARIAPWPISCHPNAGLPNAMGGYDETPESMVSHINEYLDLGLLNIVGGCCGTTPAHIAALAEAARGRIPHAVPPAVQGLHLSGLEPVDILPGSLFVNVGERCNVAGSRKFLRLIKERNLDEAITIARRQVEDGAQIIDINMDDGMMDARKEMCGFLNLISSEPDIARVPVMIDSSKWDVIEAALKCVQGKPIVNSISLKEGEQQFLDHARRLMELGAATVVMAFDEAGQADTFERKTEVCARAYRLLTERLGFNPEDIIFDPNILAIATGIKEHDRYGLDFIRAVRWIKENLPGAKVSGGVSNLSFSFRGNNYLREAMHAVFLYHAIAAGMDMAIVNPSSSVTYEEIEPQLRTLLEDVVLNRREDAAEELIEHAQKMLHEKENSAGSTPSGNQPREEEWRHLPVGMRLTHALIKGIHDHLDSDIAEALTVYPDPVAIIDGPLMDGMNRVGQLFGEGKMFLPQVVKTARTMKRAVGILTPAIGERNDSREASKKGKVVFATVKGDVHDIGKNIVSIVLACNNYEVIDLGVMVPAEKIVSTAIAEKPDFVCLSGLITPSLEEMVRVVELMEKSGLRIPVMVGGATTSRVHTAVKIAPCYSAPVIHASDASQNPLIAAHLLDSATREDYIGCLREEYAALRERERLRNIPKIPLEEARARSVRTKLKPYTPVIPVKPGRTVIDIPVADLIPYINWRFFFNAWKIPGDYSSVVTVGDSPAERQEWIASNCPELPAKGEVILHLYSDAATLLRQLAADGATACAVVTLTPAHSEGDDLVITLPDSLSGDAEIRIPTLRSQIPEGDSPTRSLADYLQTDNDYIGAFAVTVNLSRQEEKFGYNDESYESLLLQSLAHRLAEAASEYLHARVRRELWGYAAEENITPADMFRGHYAGIRPAVGYPSLPDQKLTFALDPLIRFDEIGVTLTENGAMEPSATVCGLYLAHPEASYFLIGPIADDQIADYAARRGLTPDEIRTLLAHNA
ncbi:MAG: methionine synthase [Bacteroides sp.]|nr:methionine synthase [Bacteroides sp.]